MGIIPRKLWNDFREPSVPDFDVSLCFIFPTEWGGGGGGLRVECCCCELVGFREEMKGKRGDWRLEFWRGMGLRLYLDKRVRNL